MRRAQRETIGRALQQRHAAGQRQPFQEREQQGSSTHVQRAQADPVFLVQQRVLHAQQLAAVEEAKVGGLGGHHCGGGARGRGGREASSRPAGHAEKLRKKQPSFPAAASSQPGAPLTHVVLVKLEQDQARQIGQILAVPLLPPGGHLVVDVGQEDGGLQVPLQAVRVL